uniref:Integral membrane protein n=2 Tax=Kalmanozyma brasiliensis (strain GHG001) TaxID=1365824 RepID=V5EDZ0_KALBG
MAASRRLYDQLLRRKSDSGLADNNNQGQESQRRARRADDDDRDDYHSTPSSEASGMHEDEVVDYLDVVDPEVATVTALQNVGNSIFFPPIPMLYNRRPTISLPAAVTRQRSPSARNTPRDERRLDDIEMGLRPGDTESGDGDTSRFSSVRRVASLVPGRKKKQVPPTTEEERRKHIKEWAEMDEEERNELDEHVRLLLTKKAKFKRGARGFWRYVKTPQGFIITTYAFLITFWGTAIMLFILKWINVGNPDRQRYWIEICDQILCALFAAVGLGFAPFRAVDTYRMVQIAHYHFLTYKRRRQLQLPELKDKNELPRAAPRLSVAQMTNTMMIKTKLRRSPGPEMADEGTTEGGLDETRAAGQVGPASADSSSELLEAVQSRRSADEVEKLKEKRSKKHAWLHRKKHTDEEKADGDSSKRDSAGTSSSAGGGSEPGPIEGPRKTYANKDGVIPLGQLKRNPSIASELPRDAEEEVVLSPKQQANLEYQQRKFHESHTFYRYRETVTHRPFELSLMMAIVILLDGHSCLQASLGGTTWGIYYKNRPTSVTATIITFSLSCNAVAGILIWLGGNRTKKKEEVERLLGIALEEEALRKIRKKERRKRRAEEEGEVMNELERVNSRGRDGRFIVGRVSTEVKRSSPALERIQEN